MTELLEIELRHALNTLQQAEFEDDCDKRNIESAIQYAIHLTAVQRVKEMSIGDSNNDLNDKLEFED